MTDTKGIVWAKISPEDYDGKQYKYISLAEILYLCYFAVMLGAKAIGLYEGQTAYNVCLVIGAVFFALKIIATKHSVKEYVAIALILFLGFVVYWQSGEKSLLICFTMMLGMKGVSDRRVFKLGSIIWIISFVTMYVLAVVGVIPEYASTMLRAGWPTILRHSLGYPHPNSLHASYFVIVVFVLYLSKNLSKSYLSAVSIALFLGNLYVFMYSLSRNGFLITCFYILFNAYMLLRKKRTKAENAIIMALLPVGLIFILLFPLITKGEVFESFNRHLAGRFEYTRYYLTYQPLRLFGIESIPVPQNTYEYVIDSSYVYLIFRLGIIAFIMVLAMMLLTLYDALKNDRRAEAALLTSFYLYGIIELYLFNQSYKNFTFIFIGMWFFRCMQKSPAKEYAIVGNGEICLKLDKDKTGGYPIVPANVWFAGVFSLIIVGILTSLIYVVAFPAPQDIYLPRSEEIDSGDGIPTYLTEEEVNDLLKEGNIIRGYVDENTPVYRMQSKSVVKVEHLRFVFSYGLWAGSIVFLLIVFSFIIKSRIRAFSRCKEVGPDYKETVLIVHNYYRVPGGEDVVVANEKRMLEEHGHKVVTYFRNNGDAKDSGLWSKLHLAMMAVFSFKTYREIKHVIEKEKVDVVHVHNTVALISPAVYVAGINMGVPVVQTVHNLRLVCPNGVCYINDHICENCLKYGLKASLVHNCYRNSKLQTMAMAFTIAFQRWIRTYAYLYFICLTEFNKEKLLSVKQIRDERVYVKPNFTRQESGAVPYDKRKQQIVYAGRLEKIKGLDVLLQAWMKLGENAPKLIICGSGELEDWCRDYIDNNELSNVEMLGQIDNSEAKKLIGESLAMIYPTQWYEGFPMAVAEAYTMGTPIIASDIGNVGSLVVEGVTGMKFKCNSVVSLAKTVEKFMENPVELPSEYLTMYSEENNYAMLKHIYEDVRRKAL